MGRYLMTVHEWLQRSTKRLEAAGIGTARLDCLVLLEDASDKDRAWLLAHQEESVEELVVKAGIFTTFHDFDLLIVRREKHEPLAYIREKTEFYGREFAVNQMVLEPRPESETMINLLLAEYGDRNTERGIIDVGTGSGALAITAKLELPHARVVAIDIDANCLAVAQKNAQKLGVHIEFLQGDLLQPVLNQNSELDPINSIVMANLPYVPDSYHINTAALQEPRIAIFGGIDGLDLYRKLFRQAEAARHKPAVIFTEALPFQHHQLAQLARKHGYIQTARDDFIQQFEPA